MPTTVGSQAHRLLLRALHKTKSPRGPLGNVWRRFRDTTSMTGHWLSIRNSIRFGKRISDYGDIIGAINFKFARTDSAELGVQLKKEITELWTPFGWDGEAETSAEVFGLAEDMKWENVGTAKLQHAKGVEKN